MPSVVYCKPRQEGRAKEHLEQQNFRCFLPLCRTRRSDTLIPLFPRYLFCWIPPDRAWGPILNTPGVSGLLTGTDDSPCVVPDEVIDQIKERMADEGGVIVVKSERPPEKHYEPGQTIRVIDGPHIGFEGIFVEKSKDRVIAMLRMFERDVRASIKADHVS